MKAYKAIGLSKQNKMISACKRKSAASRAKRERARASTRKKTWGF